MHPLVLPTVTRGKSEDHGGSISYLTSSDHGDSVHYLTSSDGGHLPESAT